MPRRSFFRLIALPFALLAAGLSAPALVSADARETMSVPASDIYKQMLDLADKGEFDKLSKAVDMLKPVLDESSKVLGVRIERGLQSSIGSGDKAKAKSDVVSMIAQGVKALLFKSSESSADAAQARQALKIGFTEFLLIDPVITKADFKISQKIKGEFRKANSLAGANQAQYGETCRSIVSEMESALGLK